MTYLRHTFLFLFCAFLFFPKIEAALECSRIFQSGMVIPQGKAVPVWGKADPGAKVEVSFKGQKHATKADENGRWSVSLSPMKADARGAVLEVVSGNDRNKMEDVLVGEVWLASGQSNMQWRMNQSSNKGEIPEKENPQVRIMNLTCNLHTNGGAYNLDDYKKKQSGSAFEGEWKPSTPGNISGTSAVGYLFVKELQKELNVPVGLICNAVGGTGMESWIPREALESTPKLASLTGSDWLNSPIISAWARGRAAQNLSNVKNAGETDLRHPFKPGFLYEEGLRWMEPFPVSGVLWYQGETNAELDDWEINTTLLSTLIKSWRNAFHSKNMPFVMIQLPRINDNAPLRAKWPEFREVQDEIATTLPNVFLVCTLDLGSTNSNVHPPDKLPVAKRASNTALDKIYGKKHPLSPRITQVKTKGRYLYLATDAKSLKTSDGKDARYFELEDEAGQYVPAKATFKGNVITLSAEGVSSPQNARYAWATFLEPNVVNESGLPLFPYRSLNANKPQPAAPLGTYPKGRKIKVACVGDSITAGYGIGNPASRYPQVLGELLGDKFEVKNFGNSGKTAGEYPSQKYRKQWYASTKEFEQAVAYQADIYICNLGINDTGSWWDPSLFEEGFTTIVNQLKGDRNPTFVTWGKLGPDYRGEEGKKAFPGNVFKDFKFNKQDNKSSLNRPDAEKIIQTLAKKENLYLLDAYTPQSNAPENFAKDGLHPDANGARVIAEFTYSWLARHYKLPAKKPSAKLGQK